MSFSTASANMPVEIPFYIPGIQNLSEGIKPICLPELLLSCFSIFLIIMSLEVLSSRIKVKLPFRKICLRLCLMLRQESLSGERSNRDGF